MDNAIAKNAIDIAKIATGVLVKQHSRSREAGRTARARSKGCAKITDVVEQRGLSWCISTATQHMAIDIANQYRKQRLARVIMRMMCNTRGCLGCLTHTTHHEMIHHNIAKSHARVMPREQMEHTENK